MQGLSAALAGDVALDRFAQLAVALDGQETAHFRNGGNLFREMLPISAVRSAAILLSQRVAGDSRISAGFKCKSLQTEQNQTHLPRKGCHAGSSSANAQIPGWLLCCVRLPHADRNRGIAA
jgi:hypothetical protein